MRVLVLQKYVAPYREPLFRAMAKCVDLSVLTYGAPEPRRKFEDSRGAGYRLVRGPGITLPAGYERNFEVPLGLSAAIGRERPDAVVCAPDWGGVAALRHCWRHNTRLVVWSEATSTTEAGASAAKRALRSYIYARADAFLVPGLSARVYLESLGARGPFFEVRNSIDETAFRIDDATFTAKFASTSRVVTFSGSLVKRKGIDLLLDAFAIATKRHPRGASTTTLQVIGAGPMHLPPVPGVEFTGHLDGDAYREAMRRSQVFVLPSLHDCNPLVVIEALNCGAALILSDGVGSYPEALRNNGALVPRGSAAALADALVWAMTCPLDGLRDLAQRSRRIAAEFDTQRAAASFVSAVSKLDSATSVVRG